MRILYVDILLTFAQASLDVLKVKRPDFDGDVVCAWTYGEAEKKLKESPFDLVIAAFGFEGAPDDKGIAHPRRGGIHLYQLVAKRNSALEARQRTAFCFVSFLDPCSIDDYFKRFGEMSPPPEPLIYPKLTPLDSIIRDFENGDRIFPLMTSRPERKETPKGGLFPFYKKAV